MSVLKCLEWVITSGNIVTFVFLLMFAYGIVFKLIRG